MQPFMANLPYLFLGLGALGLIAGILDSILTTINERRFIWRHPDLGASPLLSDPNQRPQPETMGKVERGLGIGCLGLVLFYVGNFLGQAPTRWTLMSAFLWVASYLLEFCLPYALIGQGVFLGILWAENLVLDIIEAGKFGGLWRSMAVGKRPREQRIEMGCIALLSLALGGFLAWLLR